MIFAARAPKRPHAHISSMKPYKQTSFPPRKTLNPPTIDMIKYCKYHHNNGHTTDKSNVLQDKIEELIRFGHLKQFVKR